MARLPTNLPRCADRRLGIRLPLAATLLLSALVGDAIGQAAAPRPRLESLGALRDLAPTAIPDSNPPAVAAAAAASSPASTTPALTPAAAYRNDATINDIGFIDPKNGWAVGDAGVIWHSDDGGRNWKQQASGLGDRLQSVAFVDAKNGWAAGGRTAPYTHLTSAVLLRTRDGGEHWTPADKQLLPASERIQFFSPTRGWAIARASAMYPCGLFFSDDGGRQWSPLPTADGADCTAGQLSDAGQGALALSDGRMAILRDGRIRAANCPPLGLRSVRRMQFSGLAGWLVGDGGLVLGTSDGGQTWQPPHWQTALASGTPLGAAGLAGRVRQYDFSAVAVRGPQVWIAGSPGDRVFHSADGGRSWTVGKTDQTVPISAITFVDDLHGWCGGALGTIAATDDGGQTWHQQRTGAERVALMGIFSEPQEVPLELFARASAADGYLSVVEVINRRDVETQPSALMSLGDRAQEVLASLGAAQTRFAWQFPLRQAAIELPPAEIKTVWDQAVEGDGMAELDAYLVRQIRIWRPSVVVTADRDATASTADRILNRAVEEAVRRAADPTFDNLTAPWTVERLFTAQPRGSTGAVYVEAAELSPRLGRTLAELTRGPEALISDRRAAAPPTFESVPFAMISGVAGGAGDFFSGLGLRPGGGARRELPQPSLEVATAMRLAALKRRNAEAVLRRAVATAPASWPAQWNDLSAAMDAGSAGEILFELAENYASAGQFDSATQVFEFLVSQYPQHPATPAALQWLLQTYASSVVERQETVGNGLRAVPGEPVAPGTPRSAFPTESPDGRLQHAIQLAGQIERSCPALFAEPTVRFPLASAYRRLGMFRESERTLAPLHSGPHDAWWACAEAESWLAQPRGPAPKSVWHCAIVNDRPRLDGSLDDAVWQRAETVRLRSTLGDDADWPATARLACDAQFLYLAVRCRKAAHASYQAADAIRPRQADLSANDRIDLILSPDRDYTSCDRLSIDYRGWVNCSCSGGAPWQPVCYVAAGMHDGDWTVEAAIPWDQMVPHPAAGSARGRRDPWAVNIQRTIPQVGFQSWSNPAGVEPRPEGMGILTFEPAAPPSAKPNGGANGGR